MWNNLNNHELLRKRERVKDVEYIYIENVMPREMKNV